MSEATNTSCTETIYVFDPPERAWYSTPLVAGDLCFALGQRGDGNVDIAVYHSSVCEDASGTYLGVVSPECLRPATTVECAGVVLRPG